MFRISIVENSVKTVKSTWIPRESTGNQHSSDDTYFIIAIPPLQGFPQSKSDTWDDITTHIDHFCCFYRVDFTECTEIFPYFGEPDMDDAARLKAVSAAAEEPPTAGTDENCI